MVSNLLNLINLYEQSSTRGVLLPFCRCGTQEYINHTYIHHAQLALEQYGFELHGSTYMQMLFNKYVLQYDQPLVESEDAELWIWRADCEVICGFLTAEGRGREGGG